VFSIQFVVGNKNRKVTYMHTLDQKEKRQPSMLVITNTMMLYKMGLNWYIASRIVKTDLYYYYYYY